MTAAFGADKTTYTIENLQARCRLDSEGAEGEHVRSFRSMARRLEKRPSLARILVHKSGPLSDYPGADVEQYADVFLRGIEEVDNVTGPAKVRPI